MWSKVLRGTKREKDALIVVVLRKTFFVGFDSRLRGRIFYQVVLDDQ